MSEIDKQVAARRIAIQMAQKQLSNESLPSVVIESLKTQIKAHEEFIRDAEDLRLTSKRNVDEEERKIRKPHPFDRQVKHGEIKARPQQKKSEADSVDMDKLLIDFDYFCRNVLQIIYRPGMNPEFPDGGYGSFILTMQQRLVANHILKGLFIDKKPVRSQILKTRQLGNTTLMMALIYFMILKMPHYSCLVIMDRDEHGDDKRELIESWADAASQRFPTFAKIASRKGKTIRFSNGSLVTIDSSQSMSPGTSMMYKFVVYSEMPKWKAGKAAEVTTSVSPGVPFSPMTCIINESTAVGRGTFYKMWKSAKGNKDDPNDAIFLRWYLSPEYRMPVGEDFKWSDDPEHGDAVETDDGYELISEKMYAEKYGLTPEQIMFRRTKISSATGSGGRDSFDQEYPTTDDHAFRVASSNFFKMATRKKWNKAMVVSDRYDLVDSGEAVKDSRPVHWSLVSAKTVKSEGGLLFVRRMPIRGSKYYIGVDVSEGRVIESKDERPKQDWSVFTVIDDNGVVCAIYRSRKKVEAAWHDLLMLARLYNNAFVQIERNAVGSGLISMLVLTNYPNMRAENGPKSWRDRVGVHLSGPNKRQTMLEHLRMVYEMSPSRPFCYVNDEETFQEQAETFINIDGKPQADAGCHDDIILSCAHAEDCRRHYLGDAKCKELVSEEQASRIIEIKEGSIADILGDAARGMWRF